MPLRRKGSFMAFEKLILLTDSHWPFGRVRLSEGGLMGTIAFLLAKQFLGGDGVGNDYQWLGLLVSLDSIACIQFLRWRRESK